VSGSLLDALLAAHEILDDVGATHALCGGLAANLYRTELRATSDVDVVIGVSPVTLVEVVERFERGGWTANASWHQGEQVRLVHPDLGRVDLLVAGTDFEHAALDHAVPSTIAGVRVVTPEDLIVMKTVAGRARDVEAVVAILVARGETLDAAYIADWVAAFGATQTWERAQLEAQLEAEA
jgi:predicted nucleotidyltransferase